MQAIILAAGMGNRLNESLFLFFSSVGGQIQKTVTYKKDWIDNNGQPVKAGEVRTIVGDEAIAELLKDREYLEYFKVEESGIGTGTKG